MKILCIGDLHFRPSQFDVGLQCLKWLETIVATHKIDMVVNLGDTFDSHQVIRSEILSEFRSHLDRMCDLLGTRKYMWVLGNHEFYKPSDSKYHALQVFKGIKDNLIIIDKPQVIESLGFIPYLSSHETFPILPTPYVFTHNTFYGADFGFKKTTEGFIFDDLPYETIISGHIHIRQTLKDKIIYPGTPYSMSSTDADWVKGVDVFDTETNIFEFIPSPFPMWRTVNIDVENYKEPDFNQKDTFIITISGPKVLVKSFIDSSITKEWKKKYTVFLKTEFTDKIKQSRISIKGVSVLDMVDSYLTKVYKGSVSPEEIKKLIESEL